MWRRVCRVILISTILLFVFLVSFPVSLIPVFIGQAFASDAESFTLVNGVILTKDHPVTEAFSTVSFQNMVINIDRGVVSSDYSQPVRSAKQDSSFDGTLKITMHGTYSGATGMSGQYTCLIDGTAISKKEHGRFTFSLTGPFSGPGGLIAGKAVTVSFGEAIGPPITICEETVTPKLPPFEMSFTVARGKSAGLPVAPGTGGKQSSAGNKGDYNGDGKVTELDALAALKMSVKQLTVILTLDMDGNGKVTAEDARLILKKAVGK